MKSEKDEEILRTLLLQEAHTVQLVWRGPEGEMIIRGIVSPTRRGLKTV